MSENENEKYLKLGNLKNISQEQTFHDKYLAYKYKYANLKKNINFYPIDSVLDNLGAYYKIIKKQYELHSGGGNYQESSTDTSAPRTSREKKYYKKYKNLIKSSAQSIGYYKNLVQLQMSNQMKLNNYYGNLISMLKSQRDRLATGYQVLGNDFKNEKEKISMLETMINGLEKYIKSNKDLDINVKKITLKGGAMGYDQFQDLIMQDMTSLADHIDGIDADKQFLESKITELHGRMNDIVNKNEELFKIKAEIEWIVNQMENVDDGADKAGTQEFDDLYSKIKGMIDTAKSKGTISKSIADYIHKLEEYAAYLENFIKTNDKTLGSIKLEKQAPKNEAVEERKTDDAALGLTASALVKAEPKVEAEVIEPAKVESVEVGNTGNTGAVVTNASTAFVPPVSVVAPEQTLSTGITGQQTGQQTSSPGKDVKATTVGKGAEQQRGKNRKRLVDDQLGGSELGKTNFSDLIGGGSFIDQYKARSESMKSQLKKLFENEYANVQIVGKEFIIESLADQDKSKDFPIFFGKLATVSGLLLKLDLLLNDYNKLYDFLKNNIDLLRHDDASGYDLVQLWKDVFKAKKTDYYTEKLLKLQIFFYNYTRPEDKSIELEDALKNLVKLEETAKIIIKVDDLPDVKSSIDFILNSLDNTVVSFDHLIFFIENMVLTFLQGTKDKESEPAKQAEMVESIKSFEQRISKRRDNLLKSAFVSTSGVYSILYGQTGGSSEIKLPSEALKIIEPEDRDIFLELFRLYSASILVPSDRSPMTLTNQKQIERTISLTYMMMSLYDKINLKLGSTDDRSMFTALTDEQKSIKKYAQFNELIEKLKTESKPQTVVEVSNGKSQTSEISKPRLDIYRNRLISCREELKPYMKNIAILRNLLFETKAGTFSTEETKILISLYNKVKRQIEEGINSYIKLIPMIFFTIEFPPAVYATQKCKYRFTFDTKKEMVEYKFIEGQDKAECNNLGLGEFKETEFNPNLFNSHAAFFESNKLNGTKKLIDDPVIGLGKLIKQDESGTKPISATINMMFALGASGTGKTTRYFGKSSGGHPDDKEGIVPYIINKSLEDAKTSDPNAPPTKKVSIAYFVCYGQKNQTTGTDAGFNELAIFFNIKKIKQSNGGVGKEPDASVTVDEKYIPYYMGKTAEIAEEKVNKYTNFYSAVVNKKLSRSTYTDLKEFITDGGAFPTLKTDPNPKTFRELLNSTDEIWKEIDPKESSAIGELFEELIIEQKKINTVLPTKNNIESSRGHTCVLVKIEDLVATTNKVKYFPLFDMAGTENTGQIDEFLKTNRDKNRMAKLVQKVNTITQKKDILRADDETKQYPSLNDLLKYSNISSWVAASNKYLTLESVGGGKSTIKVEDFYNQELLADKSTGPGENFLNKVVKEGYYINHTISMLIYAAMCVGSSLRTELVNTGSSRVDKFDDFLPELFGQIDKFTCIPAEPVAGKTMMLLAKKTPGAIVNASCIWLQILFSFLYWNEETPKSITEWLQNITPDTTDSLTYLCEPDVQSAEIKTIIEQNKEVNVMTVEQLFKVGKVSDPNDGLSKLYTIMTNINKTHKFTSAGTRKLENEVSVVNVEANKLKIQYQTRGGPKSFVSTEANIELKNNSYDANEASKYETAKRIRTELKRKNPKLAYPIPASPTVGRGSPEWQLYDKLSPADKQAYPSVADVTEYTEPEKVKATGKIYWDFFENTDRTNKLDEFKELLKGFLSTYNETKFKEKKSLPKTISTGTGRNKTTSKNPEYDNFITEVDEVLQKLKTFNLFNSADKSKASSPTEPPLVESFKYDVKSIDFGETDDIVSKIKRVNKDSVTYNDLVRTLNTIKTIEQIREKKLSSEAAERSSFTMIPDVIAELNNLEKIPQADLATITNLLKETNSTLELSNAENKFNFVRNGVAIPIGQVIQITNQYPMQLPTCPTNPVDINKITTENQMHRIKDGRAAATKMTLMHLVTGQGVKHFMVEETIKLCKTLYDSTNLDLSV